MWPNGARLAVSIVVNVEEGSELSVREGDRGPEPVDELGIVLKKPIRNQGNESNYLYGIKAGAPRILRLLEKYRVRATFTAAALSLERAPELASRIVQGGHEACSHGWRWTHQFQMDEAQEATFISKAVESLERTTGTRPYGWLSRYLITENTRSLLAKQGFLYHMDDYSDDVPFWDRVADRNILVMPYALDSNDMKMWLSPAATPSHWLEYAIDTFEWLYEEGQSEPKMMSIGLHLRIMGRPGRMRYLEAFLDHVTRRDDVWVTTRLDIAKHWVTQFPPPH